MRVLLVNAHGADPALGGAERYVRDLAHGLIRRGHEAVILSAFPQRGDPGVETQVLHASDWRDDRIRRLRNHAGDLVSVPWPRLERLVRGLHPDLVHTSNLPGIGTGIWEVARRLGVPAVHTLHDYHLLCPRVSLTRRDGTPCRPSPLLCGLRTRSLARWATAVSGVIAGSEHLLRAHDGLFPQARANVVRLPLAPLDGAPPEPPAALRTVGYLGVLTPEKGVRLLPEIARDGVEVRVAGDGPLRAEIEAAPVSYEGRLEGEAKLAFMRSCDLGIVPSLWDEPSGPPYVVCEWLAMRRPVLVTRRGGLAETASLDGVVAVEPEGLAEAVRALREALPTVPAVTGDTDVQRWLDEHERVYGEARA